MILLNQGVFKCSKLNTQQLCYLSFFWVAVQQKMNTPNSVTNQEDSGNKKKTKKAKQAVEKVPSSDAILSCPACMTTLCIDCQR